MKNLFGIVVFVIVLFLGVKYWPLKNAESVIEDNSIYDRIGNIGWQKITTVGEKKDGFEYTSGVISPDNKYIVCTYVKKNDSGIISNGPNGDKSIIYFYGLKDYKKYRTITEVAISNMKISPNGENLVIINTFGTLSFYEIKKNKITTKNIDSMKCKNTIIFSEDSKFMGIEFDDEIDIWDLEKKEIVQKIKKEDIFNGMNRKAEINLIDFSNDKNEIVIEVDRDIVNYDYLNNKVKYLVSSNLIGNSILKQYIKSSDKLIYVFNEETIRIIKISTGAILKECKIKVKENIVSLDPIRDIKLNKDETLAMIFMREQKQIKIIDLKKGREVDNIYLELDKYASDFSNGGNYITVIDKENGIELYKVNNITGNIEDKPQATEDKNKVKKFIGDKSLNSGKYYFEVNVKLEKELTFEERREIIKAERIQTETLAVDAKELLKNVDFGVTDSKTGGMMVGMSNYISKDSLEDGDCIMVAIDFDSKIIYFGKNNSWIFCDPVAGRGGKSLSTFSNILPYLMVTNKEELKINFGGEPFKGTMPTGYNKYNLNNMSQVN